MKNTTLITAIIGLMLIPPLTGKAASRWIQSTSIGGANIMGITSLELDEAWAVSGNLPGEIYSFDGSHWTVMTETGTQLQGIDAYYDDEIWAVGYYSGTGRIFYYDGAIWSLQSETAGSDYLFGIFAGSPGRIWAVGDNGIIYRNYGTDFWTIHTDTGDDTWYAIDGIDQDNFWVAGGLGDCKIMNWYGSPVNAWTVMTEVALGGTNRLWDLAVVSPPNLWACGDDGIIMHYDGSVWSIFTDLGSDSVYTITAYPQEEESVRAATGDGKIYRFNGSDWKLETDLGAVPIRSLDSPIEYCALAGAAGKLLKSVPIRRVFDYNGDGFSDIAIFRASSGLWAVRNLTRVYFGTDGDTPVPGDYDGDGITDIAIFRPSTGLWAARSVTRAYFGNSSDQPIARDYTGDWRTDIGIFRQSSGLWALRGITRFYFGTSGDTPVPEDYNSDVSGDGAADIVLFRESTGLWAWRGVTRVYFGRTDDLPVSGYYHDPYGCSPAIFRPSTGLWAVMQETRWYFGNSSDTPVPADYGRKDYRDTIGIFRPSPGLWAWAKEGGRVYFGGSGDIPVTR
jgi:hypothetical protein